MLKKMFGGRRKKPINTSQPPQYPKYRVFARENTFKNTDVEVFNATTTENDLDFAIARLSLAVPDLEMVRRFLVRSQAFGLAAQIEKITVDVSTLARMWGPHNE